MKINKNSWHYKLLEKNASDNYYDLLNGRTVTLCNYFWSVVGYMLKTVCGWFAIAMGAMAFTWLLVSMLLGVVTLFFATWLPVNEVIADISFIGIVMNFVVIVTTVIHYGAYLIREGRIVPNYLKFTKSEKVVEAKPNLLFDYLKAKKHKVCPLLELED